MENKCDGLFGFLFGHKFEDVFEKVIGEFKNPFGSEDSLTIALVQDRHFVERCEEKKTRYVHTVCRRCGKIINRKDVI